MKVFKQIDHLGIVVSDVEQAVTFYERLGYRLRLRAALDGGATQVAFVDPPAPGAALELMEPTPGIGMLGEFLKEKGPGVHHVAFWVPDVDEALAQLREQGVSLMEQQSRVGLGDSRIAYVGYQEGVLIQLVHR